MVVIVDFTFIGGLCLNIYVDIRVYMYIYIYICVYLYESKNCNWYVL